MKHDEALQDLNRRVRMHQSNLARHKNTQPWAGYCDELRTRIASLTDSINTLVKDQEQREENTECAGMNS